MADETVTFTQTTVGSLVAALDPNHLRRDVAYVFSNGKTFLGSEYDDSYDTMEVGYISYDVSCSGNLEMLDELEMLDSLEMR